MTSYTLAQLAEHLGAELRGNGAEIISAIATLETATAGQLTFLANPKYRKFLGHCQATAVLVSAADADLCPGAALIVPDPYVAFAKIAQLLDTTPAAAYGRHATAIIASDAIVAETASIGPFAVIAAGAVIGEHAQIGAHSYVGEGAVIGSHTKLWSHVNIYHAVRIGQRCIIHSGAVIGSDGFGFANERGRWVKIPQTGTVVIGDDCEIGASTSIDRGALGDTVIGNNVILDNQLQIAHNVQIGDHTAMAACSVVAGSTKIGRYCVIAGGVGINGHIEICDGVQITGMSMITKSITEKGVYSSGIPATENMEWRKTTARYRHLDEMHQRIRELEQRVAALASNAVQTDRD
jgi:UDP-3-O-[3-hydroxymyristoyl] glucosamine N-acyltransferase